jgi:peptidoglycan hydrolase-like protein with peptidoglycan-binding domain
MMFSASKLAGLMCAALTVCFGVNLFFLQAQRRVGASETAILNIKPIQPTGTVGDAASTDVATTNMATAAVAPTPSNPNDSVATGSIDPAQVTPEIVRGIQRELNARGFEVGTPDGVTGMVTRAAILAFEHDYGLPATATPSSDLLSRIVLGSSGQQASARDNPPIATPEAETVIRSAKQYLTALGYPAGKADGAITPQFSRALRDFEIAQKLPESGRISGPTMGRLIRLQAHLQKPKAPTARQVKSN